MAEQEKQDIAVPAKETAGTGKKDEEHPNLVEVKPRVFYATENYRRKERRELTLSRGLRVVVTHKHKTGMINPSLVSYNYLTTQF